MTLMGRCRRQEPCRLVLEASRRCQYLFERAEAVKRDAGVPSPVRLGWVSLIGDPEGQHRATQRYRYLVRSLVSAELICVARRQHQRLERAFMAVRSWPVRRVSTYGREGTGFRGCLLTSTAPRRWHRPDQPCSVEVHGHERKQLPPLLGNRCSPNPAERDLCSAHWSGRVPLGRDVGSLSNTVGG